MTMAISPEWAIPAVEAFFVFLLRCLVLCCDAICYVCGHLGCCVAGCRDTIEASQSICPVQSLRPAIQVPATPLHLEMLRFISVPSSSCYASTMTDIFSRLWRQMPADEGSILRLLFPNTCNTLPMPYLRCADYGNSCVSWVLFSLTLFSRLSSLCLFPPKTLPPEPGASYLPISSSCLLLG